MKTFKTVLKHLESIGFKENQHRFNERQLKQGFKSILGTSLTCVYLFYVVNTLEEFMDGMFLLIVASLVLISNVNTVFKTATIFIFIKKFDTMINQSE